MNWRKWNTQARERSRRAQHAAEVRWARHHAGIEAPPRETRVVEMSIRDSHRPMRTLRFEADETERGWGRWRVSEGGARIGERRFGRTAIGALIARSLMWDREASECPVAFWGCQHPREGRQIDSRAFAEGSRGD
jgi:hypothetical protein